MKRIFLCLLMLFFSSQIHARRVFPGEMLWNMAQLTTEASYDVAISQDNMPLTISTSGTYTFAQSLTGNITIAANNVVVDLNGHTLTGSISTNGFTNIIVRNGFINQTTAVAGLTINNFTNIQIEDIDFRNGDAGIECTSTGSNVLINNCSFTDQVGVGIALTNVRVTNVTNCSFWDITVAGGGVTTEFGVVRFFGCEDAYCENLDISNNTFDGADYGMVFINTQFSECVNCRINNNTGTANNGVCIYISSESTANIVDNCEITNNAGPSTGILHDLSSTGGVIKNCKIESNTSNNYSAVEFNATSNNVIENCKILGNSAALVFFGVNLQGATQVTVANNIVVGNTGSSSSRGIIDQGGGVSNLVINNQVRNNSGTGIVNSGSTNSYFLGNISSGNAVANYTGVPIGTVNVVTYDISAGTYNTTPVATSNIDAVP